MDHTSSTCESRFSGCTDTAPEYLWYETSNSDWWPKNSEDDEKEVDDFVFWNPQRSVIHKPTISFIFVARKKWTDDLR